MSKVIHKYPLEDGKTNIQLPQGSVVLKVGYDLSAMTPVIWVLKDVEFEYTQWRTFTFFGTGHTIENPETLEYIDSVQMTGISLVWHVFEVTS